MLKKRIIARIDIKNEFVIKGIHLEGLRKIGNPIDLAKKYFESGIDEIIFMDAVASLYGRNNLLNIIENASKEVFIPITIGGGIRNLDDIELALNSGADKIAINTQAIRTPELIKEASRRYGSQCIVGSIEAKKTGNFYEAYIENGRQPTGIDAIQWACELQDLGVGELFITSIDQEGTKKGFDANLANLISQKTNIPLIMSGGAGNLEHIINFIDETKISAVALASLLHYNINSISQVKESLIENGQKIRL